MKMRPHHTGCAMWQSEKRLPANYRKLLHASATANAAGRGHSLQRPCSMLLLMCATTSHTCLGTMSVVTVKRLSEADRTPARMPHDSMPLQQRHAARMHTSPWARKITTAGAGCQQQQLCCQLHPAHPSCSTQATLLACQSITNPTPVPALPSSIVHTSPPTQPDPQAPPRARTAACCWPRSAGSRSSAPH